MKMAPTLNAPINGSEDCAALRNESSERPEEHLLRLFLLTSILLTFSGSLLSQNIEASTIAIKLCSFVVVLILSIGFLWRITRSVEVSVLIFTAYLWLALWVGSRWLVAPLVIMAITFVFFGGRQGVRRFHCSLDSWINSGIAAGLILAVTHYSDFLILEKLRQAVVHKDTLFHASVASMIKTYGVSSSGLHGLVEVHFHILSHRMFAALSILSGVHVLETYGVLPIIFLGPLLIATVTWCAFRLSNEVDSRVIGQKWLVVCTVLIFLKILPLERWAVLDDYFVSESYTLSLAFFMLALPFIVSSGSGPGSFIVASALIILAGLSKGSVGIFAICLLWSSMVRDARLISRLRTALVAITTTILFIFLMSGAARTASVRTMFEPFYYLRKECAWGDELSRAVIELFSGRIPQIALLTKALVAVGAFLIFNYILSWVVLMRRWLAGGARTVWTQPDSFFSLVAVVVSLPTLLFAISGGEWYFINPPMFVALPFVVAALGACLREWPAYVLKVLMALSLLGVSIALSENYIRNGGGAFTKSSRGLIPARVDTLDNIRLLFSLRDQKGSRQIVFERGENFPKPNTGWDCSTIPFLYPAVTERAWIGILDLTSDCEYRQYSYPNYFIGSPRRLIEPVLLPNLQIVRVSRQP